MLKKLIAIILGAVILCGVLPFAVFAQEEINLALGVTYIIETGEPIAKSYQGFTVNGTEFNKDGGQLTDAVAAPLSQDSPAWYRAYSGQSRIVTFDLGAQCAISSVSAGFLQSKAAQIYAPRYINIWLSDNGTDYELVYEHSDKAVPNSSVTSRYDAQLLLESVYAARYVRVEFCTDAYTYCDEISIIGSKTLLGSERKVDPTPAEDRSGYLGSVAGTQDIVKLYNGYYPQDPSVGVLTEAELLPYIAYVDATGEAIGKMFDSILLSPCDAAYPSGGKLNKADGFSGAVISDYELYLEHTFTAGQDLDAIDKVVGKVYSKLGITDKLGIFLSIPYPTVLNKPFGDLDGDGVVEYCRTLEDRTAIIEWYVDKCIAAFAENAYDNIEFLGFGWYRETVNYADSDHEAEILKAMNAYVHRFGLETISTFGYLSSGFDHWASLGFDGAVMQPEIYKNNFSPEMLSEFAVSVYNNHLGAEIQTCTVNQLESADNGYLELGYDYESHLYYGSKTGYLSALNVYEQDIGPGTLYNFCYADISTPKGIYLRRLYDLTYRYINGNYINIAPGLSVETDVEIVYGDSQIMLDLGINDIDSHWENITVEFPKEPEHGRVTAAASKKTLIYNVDSDFIGTDSFTVCINDGFNRSEEVTVNITVSKPAPPDKSGEDSVPVTIPPSNPKTNIPLWLIIMLVILASAMLIVAIVTIVKPKRDEE